MTPLACSGTSRAPTTPKSTDPCLILRLTPPPELDAQACGDRVCLSVADTLALSLWIADVEETRHGLDGCPLVQLTDN